VGAAITDDDLGGVLVGHDDGGARQSAPVGVWVVGLERLAGHASVQVVSHFEHIRGEGGGLTGSVLARVNGLLVRVGESDANSLAVLHEDGLARGHSRVLEVLVRHHSLRHMQVIGPCNVLVHLGSDLLGGFLLGEHDRLGLPGRLHNGPRYAGEWITVHHFNCRCS